MFQSLFGKPKTPEDKFWNEFITKIPQLEATDNAEAIVSLVRPILDRYKVGLAFELNVNKEENSHLIISAEGIKSNFSAVQKLVENAPEIPKWRITPFRQRREDRTVRFFDPPITLTDQDIFFKIFHSDEPDKVDIAVFVKGIDPNNENDPVVGVSFIYLDSLFGEFDIISHIGVLEFYPLPSDLTDLLNSADVLAIFDREIYNKPLPD